MIDKNFRISKYHHHPYMANLDNKSRDHVYLSCYDCDDIPAYKWLVELFMFPSYKCVLDSTFLTYAEETKRLAYEYTGQKL